MIKANDIKRESWIKYDQDCDFPIQNIPFGVFRTKQGIIHIGTILGATVISLSQLELLGYFKKTNIKPGTFNTNTLNKFIKQGRPIWREVRDCIALLFDKTNRILKENQDDQKIILFQMLEIEMILPINIGDYTDFYSSKDHATNVGKMFRDPDNALLPNWLHIPVGYHGRSSSIVISGTDIKRPQGQVLDKITNKPFLSKSKLLDFELEMGFITGEGKALGHSISTDQAEEYIFGLCLFNDWSARDIQKWEYVPLGPFLGKNFASSMSPWIISLDALDGFRVYGEKQIPQVLPYLSYSGKRNYDINLEVFIQPNSQEESLVSQSNFKYMYWNMCQQLAHHTINGCNIKAGDLMASGTISGPKANEYGSMLELSWGGKHSIKINNNEERKFIMDGDTVIMRGFTEKDGIRIGFGEVKNKIV